MSVKNISNRLVTTLFMLMFVEGEISSGILDELDVDKDFLMRLNFCTGME